MDINVWIFISDM